MKCRFLYAVFSFLVLFSSTGISAQKAVFSSSDDVKIITVHSASQEFISVSSNESKAVERSFSRFQKKSDFSNCFSEGLYVEAAAPDTLSVFPSSNISVSTYRVLLLPKSIQTIIFLQTLV